MPCWAVPPPPPPGASVLRIWKTRSDLALEVCGAGTAQSWGSTLGLRDVGSTRQARHSPRRSLLFVPLSHTPRDLEEQTLREQVPSGLFGPFLAGMASAPPWPCPRLLAAQSQLEEVGVTPVGGAASG